VQGICHALDRLPTQGTWTCPTVPVQRGGRVGRCLGGSLLSHLGWFSLWVQLVGPSTYLPHASDVRGLTYACKSTPAHIPTLPGNHPNVSVYAFEHYRRNVVGGKPEYNLLIETWQDEALYAPQIQSWQPGRKFAGPVFHARINCQKCWNVTAYYDVRSLPCARSWTPRPIAWSNRAVFRPCVPHYTTI